MDTDNTQDTGKTPGRDYEVGYGKPPKATQFGGPRANPRNRSGRPRSFDELRRLAQDVANEQLVLPNDEKQRKISRIKVLLRRLANSGNPAAARVFLEYAYGKPIEAIDITTAGNEISRVIIRYEEQINVQPNGDNPPEVT